jgi:hypothetical protein
VINKEGDDFDFFSKSLVAAKIFLYTPDNLTIVRYHLSIPCLDFQDDNENRFNRTHVVQTFAIFLNSLSAKAPS